MTAEVDQVAQALALLLRKLVREEVARQMAETARPDEYLNTAAAAKLAAVTGKTIRRWIGEGKLVGHRAGREVRVLRSDLERLLRGEGGPRVPLSREELARKYLDAAPKKGGRR